MNTAEIMKNAELLAQAYICYRTLFEDVPDVDKLKKLAEALEDIELLRKISDIESDLEHMKESIAEDWDMKFVNANCAEDLEDFISVCEEQKADVKKLIDRLEECRSKIKALINEEF